MIWNFAHCVVTQQLLCYKLAGEAMHLSDDIIAAYKKGSRPEGDVDQIFVDMISEKSKTTIDQIVNDLERGLFNDYKEYPTSFGVTMRNIEDAIVFNNMHEAMHLGTMLALKNLVI